MSSFRRKTPTSTAARHAHAQAASFSTPSPSALAPSTGPLRGTKPFLSGQTLTSSGLTQLDTILGGGLLLGTLQLLDVPRQDLAAPAAAQLVDDLHRYFLAQGIVSGQRVVLVSEDAAGFAAHQLPMELSLAQKQVRHHMQHQQETKQTQEQSVISPISGDDAETMPVNAPLTIAWQYGKYLGNTQGPTTTPPPTITSSSSSSAATPRFCHSFDLSRPMHPELVATNPPMLIEMVDHDGWQRLDMDNDATIDAASRRVTETYARLSDTLANAIQTASFAGTAVVRVCLRDVGASALGSASIAHMTAILALLRRLRALATVHPMVCQLSGHWHRFPPTFVASCRHVAACVVAVKSFHGEQDLLPAELASFQALLEVHKLARVQALASYAPDAVRFGVKRERRKLKIEKFHLPPEGVRTLGNGSATAKTKSRASGSGSGNGNGNGSGNGSGSRSALVASAATAVRAGCGSHNGGGVGASLYDF